MKCQSVNPPVVCCADDGREIEWVDLREFLPRVTLSAQGVPESVALEFLGQAAIDLARGAHLLKRHAKLDIQRGVRDYFLGSNGREQVDVLLSVDFKGRFDDALPHLLRHAAPMAEYRFEPPDKVFLKCVPSSDCANGLVVDYLAIPTQSACEVDKLLFDRYQDVVVSGALAQILLLRKYDFADVQLAAVYEQRFKSGVHRAINDAQRDFVATPREIQPFGRI